MNRRVPGCGDLEGWSQDLNTDRPQSPQFPISPSPRLPDSESGPGGLAVVAVLLLGTALTLAALAAWLLL